MKSILPLKSTFNLTTDFFPDMKKLLSLLILPLALLFAFPAFAQNINIPQAVMLRIIRAEDELRFDRDLQDLLKSPDAKIRRRAALAAGRIGSENAIPPLSALLDQDTDQDVRTMAAFALGEIESAKAADAILKVLSKKGEADAVRARALEAAGKIAAANPKDAKSRQLGESILDWLEAEQSLATRSREIVLLGLTAALRAKPDEADFVVGKFLTDKDVSVRADALNTLVRLKSKNDNLKAQYRAMLLSDDDAVVRANAARALGASEDAMSLDLLIEAATTDDDQRVRVAAIRSLGLLKDKKAAASLLERGKKLLEGFKTAKSKFSNPAEKNELLEIVATVGNLLAGPNNTEISEFIRNFIFFETTVFAESEIASAKISPKIYAESAYYNPSIKIFIESASRFDWQNLSSIAQGLGEVSHSQDEEARKKAKEVLQLIITKTETEKRLEPFKLSVNKAIPDLLRAYIAFKPIDAQIVLLKYLNYQDAIIRATAAELLGDLPASRENIEALKTAFAQALQKDKEMNDAQLAILSALVKLDKTQTVDSLKLALDASDFLVRRQAAQLIKQNDLTKDFPNLDAKVGTVKPYNPATKTKLGQILNTNADYIRAVSRKNGQIKAILTIEKGIFTIDLLPEDAPLTVDNFVKLAKSGYFNGIAFHRVVPNFVVQGGDPRGDGNGGPGWQIRCEINLIPFERGAVGMALSGKDTGGSQWFVTHSPQPHLDGGYTVFGRVNETDMKIVDTIARGDKILSVKIIEESILRKSAVPQRKKK